MTRITNYKKTLPIIEIYTAVQGEGKRVGMPTIVIRTTGCTHRCWFGEGGWCDSWYTSIHPEKGKYCFQDIIDLYDKNPQIKEMMITGGSPSMLLSLINELTYFAEERNIVTTIETEGSHFIETDKPIDLISLSPKFSNSVPKLGITTPGEKIVDQKFINQHNKFRLNYENIVKTLSHHHRDFQIKPVIDKDLKIIPEIEEFLDTLANKLFEARTWVNGWVGPFDREEYVEALNNSVYAMPAGDTREELLKSYPVVMNLCVERGWNFTGRPHIIAFDQDRMV